MTRARLGLRIVAVLGVAAAALVRPSAPAVAGTAACSDGGPCVIVRVVTGSDTLVTRHEFSVQDINHNIGDLGADAPSIPYQTRTPRGELRDFPVPAPATSIQQLLTHVPLPAGGFLAWQSVTYTAVPRRGASTLATLQTADLGNSGQNGFAEGLMPAVYVNPGSGGSPASVGYIRPLRGPRDVNIFDSFQELGGDPLVLTAHTTGHLLAVQASAAPSTTTVGAAVALHATVTGQAVPPLSYRWDFGDGTSSKQSAPSHHWPASGTYYVAVTVRGADGSYGQSQGVPVRVGAAPPRHGHHGPGTGPHHRPHHPPSGPDHGGGHQQGGHPGGSPRPHPGHPTTGATDGPTAGPSDGPTAGPTGHASTGPTTRRTTSHAHRRRAPSGAHILSGRLLVVSQTQAAPPPSLALQQATAAQEAARLHQHWPWRWAWLLAVPLLIGLGMAGESLQLRRRLARMGA